MSSVGIVSHNHRTVSSSESTQGAPLERDRPPGPQWRQWTLAAYVHLEPSPDAESLALWLKDAEESGHRVWERIKALPRSRFTIDTNISAVQATSLRLRERVQGVFGRLFQRFRSNSSRTWVLPNGHRVEEVGERVAGRGEQQTDVLLMWSEGEGISLDEAWIVNRWPESTRRQRLGENLYVVAGVQLTVPNATPARECPHSTAERLLKAARDIHDASRELDALADLGAAYLHEGRSDQAISVLEDALRLARKLGAGDGERAGGHGRGTGRNLLTVHAKAISWPTLAG